METHEFEQDLVCSLDEEGKKRHADAAAAAGQKQAEALDLVDTHREAARIAAEEAKGYASEVALHLRAHRSGQEERRVACVEDYDEALNRMLTTRTDTGEIINARPVEEHDRQLRIFPEQPDQEKVDRTPAGA